MRISRNYRRFCRNFLCACYILFISFSFIAKLSAQIREPSEFELKVALLYNFALFTEWPMVSGNTLNLCLYGQDPYGSAIQVLKKKSIQNRPLHINYLRQLTDIDNCQVLYIYSLELSQVEFLVTQISSKPILTIVDVPGNDNHIGIINLAMEKQKIRFDINLPAANRAGLSLSSKLLRLAREVHQ